MKTIHKILLATAVAASFALVNRASADEFLTPRAMGNQIKTVSGVNNDPNLLTSNPVGTPKIVEQTATITAPNANSNQDPNLLSQYDALPGTPKEKQLSTES
jgi:hypothetical protein